VQVASGFAADIRISKGSKEVNGKSIMGVMMLAAAKGTTLQLVADGCDECEALQRLESLVAERFGEAE
jgi:phosphocarrier protein HPr